MITDKAESVIDMVVSSESATGRVATVIGRRRLLILMATPVVVYGVVAFLGPPLTNHFLAQVFADLVDQSKPMEVDPGVFRMLGAVLALTATIRIATELWRDGWRTAVRRSPRRPATEPSARSTTVAQANSGPILPCACGATMVLRQRRSDGSPFWGCSRFPACRQTRAVKGAG